MEGRKRAPWRFEWVILSLTTVVMILFFVGGTFAANLQQRYTSFERRNRSDFNREMDPHVGDVLKLPFKLTHEKNRLYFLGGCASCSLDSLDFRIFKGDPTAVLFLETDDESMLRSYRKLYPDLRFEPYGEELKRRFNTYYTPRAYILTKEGKVLYVQGNLVPTKQYEEFIRDLR